MRCSNIAMSGLLLAIFQVQFGALGCSPGEFPMFKWWMMMNHQNFDASMEYWDLTCKNDQTWNLTHRFNRCMELLELYHFKLCPGTSLKKLTKTIWVNELTSLLSYYEKTPILWAFSTQVLLWKHLFTAQLANSASVQCQFLLAFHEKSWTSINGSEDIAWSRDNSTCSEDAGSWSCTEMRWDQRLVGYYVGFMKMGIPIKWPTVGGENDGKPW